MMEYLLGGFPPAQPSSVKMKLWSHCDTKIAVAQSCRYAIHDFAPGIGLREEFFSRQC